MSKSELILGPPGCGKTHFLIRKVEDLLAAGYAPDQIAFVSFTRKAVHEAVERACKSFDLVPKDLPYFKTLHAFAYHGLGLKQQDLMMPADYKALGEATGMKLNVSKASAFDTPMMETLTNDVYLRMIDRAALRCVSLQQELRDSAQLDARIRWRELDYLSQSLENYKQATQKMTFTDMLTAYLQVGEVPRIKVLIVDEAQDLTPLQWKMVRKIAELTEKIFFAGDDDQAIHKWAGVDIGYFFSCSTNIRVLDQSYRLPRQVFDFAHKMSMRISQRQPKEWRPRDEEGEVLRHSQLQDVPLKGSTTILARTNNIAAGVLRQLREEGRFFSYKHDPSIPQNLAWALWAWDELCEGRGIHAYASKCLYQNLVHDALAEGALEALKTADPEGALTLHDLQQDYGLRIAASSSYFWNVAPESLRYAESVRSSGIDIRQEPEIKVSTIHASKGGEDDTVVLLQQSPSICVRSRDQDTEHRVFYVGATRARHTLHVVSGEKGQRYEIH